MARVIFVGLFEVDTVIVAEPIHLCLIQRVGVVSVKLGEYRLIENVLVAFTCECHCVGNCTVIICSDLHSNGVPSIVSDDQ